MIIFSLLFIAMKVTMGQPPEHCFCHLADGTLSCSTPGCSTGTNPFCSNGFVVLHHYPAISRNGCHCPRNASQTHNTFHDRKHNRNRHRQQETHNGFVGRAGYHYETCTAFGSEARDRHGHSHVQSTANAATDCCNYCCGRMDPQPFPVVVTPASNDGRQILSSKLFYLHSLIMFAFFFHFHI